MTVWHIWCRIIFPAYSSITMPADKQGNHKYVQLVYVKRMVVVLSRQVTNGNGFLTVYNLFSVVNACTSLKISSSTWVKGNCLLSYTALAVSMASGRLYFLNPDVPPHEKDGI